MGVITARRFVSAARPFQSYRKAAIVVAALMTGIGVTISTISGDDEPGPIEAVEAKLDRPADFRTDVLPILQAKCLACHSESVKEGGLVLESPASIREGGDSGPAVVPAKPGESLLALAAGRRGDLSAMPPLPNDVDAASLTPEELGRLNLWIQEGARDSDAAKESMQWQSLPPGIDAVYSLALDRRERFVAAGQGNRIHLYDVIQMRELALLGDPALGNNSADQPVAHRDIVSSLAFSPDGQWLASGGYRIVKLWRRRSPLQRRQELEYAVKRLVVSPDGRWLAAGLADGSLRVWDRTNGDQPAEVSGHETSVTGVTFAGETNLISIAGPTLRIRDIGAKGETRSLTLASAAQAVVGLPGTRQFATGHEDGLIRIWAIDTLLHETANEEQSVEPQQELPGHTKAVTSLAWMADEKPRLVSGSDDGTIRLWETETWKQTQQVEHGAPVSHVASARDGGRTASAGTDNVVRLWDATGKKVAEFTGDPRQQMELSWRQDDLKVAQSRKSNADKSVSDAEKDVNEREESLAKAREQLAAAEKQVAEATKNVGAAARKRDETTASLEEMPEDEGRKKAKSAADEELTKQRETLKKAEDAVVSVRRAVELSEKSVATVKAELETHKQRREAEAAREDQAAAAVTTAEGQANTAAAGIRGVAFGPEGDRLILADEDGRIVQWHVNSKRPLDVLETESAMGVRTLCVTPDGRIVTGTNDGHLDVWRSDPAWMLAGHLGPSDSEGHQVSESLLADRVLSIDFSPDGVHLATGSGAPSRSGQLLLWDLESRSVDRDFADAHSDTVFDVAFSRDGTLLASGAADKFAKVFDVASGELKQNFEGHTGHVLSVAWQADGSVLATGGADNAIKAWTTATGEQQRTITSHKKPVTSVAFAGIEEKLASASGDQNVLLHTVSSGKNDRRLEGASDFLHAVLVNRDLSRVIAGCEDGGVRIWDGTDGKLLKAFNSD